MSWNFREDIPIFIQLASFIEDDIFCLKYKEGEALPSTTELSATLRINPATVLKGVNILVDEGLVEKRRGLGMYVKENAREMIKEKRKASFSSSFVFPLVNEAKKLGMTEDEILDAVKKEIEND